MSAAPFRLCALLGAAAQSDIAAQQTADIMKRFFMESSQTCVMKASTARLQICKHRETASVAREHRYENPASRNQF
jgi:hypothetical protein